MDFRLLKDTAVLLAVSTFIGSIAIFTDYLKNSREDLLGGKDWGKVPFLSDRLCKAIIFLNYLAILLVWTNIGLLLLFSSCDESPILYKFVTVTLFCSVLILIVVIILQWHGEFFDSKLRKRKIPQLRNIRISDLDALENLDSE